MSIYNIFYHLLIALDLASALTGYRNVADAIVIR